MPFAPPSDPESDDILMFGEEADDDTPVGGGQPTAALDGDARKAGLDTSGDPAAGEEPAAPDKKHSLKVVGIVGNTPHAHAHPREADQDQDDQDQETDWEAIEQDYRAGIISVPVLAAEYDVHHTTIYRRAKKYGWTRNLAHKVRACAEQTLLFGNPDKGKGATRTGEGTDPHAHEAEVIKAAASVQVLVVERHRKDLSQLRALQARLVEQAENFFEDQDSKKSLITNLAELQTAVQTVESLSRTVGRVIPLERAAFNIDAKQGPAAEAQAIERRVQAAADRKRASPDDPQAVQRATRALNDARRRQKLTDRHLADHEIEPSRGE